jgi:hypothetical protein
MTPLLFVIIIAAVFMLMLLWAPKKSPQAPTSFQAPVAWQGATSPRQVAMVEDLRVFADTYKSHLTQLHRDEVLGRVKAMMSTVDVPPTKASK